MKKKLLSVFLAAVLTIAVLSGCSTEQNNSSSQTSDGNKENNSKTLPVTEKVILNEVAHSIFYAPMYIAIEEGYFAEEGIDLELVTGFGDNVLGTDALKKPRIYVKKKYFYFWHFA